MNIGQYLARTKEQAIRKKLRETITELNREQDKLAKLRAELASKTPPQDNSEAAA